jgi:hypothetical protein
LLNGKILGMSSEAPQFKEPLDNPNLSHEENRQMDKLTDIMSAEAARRILGKEKFGEETTASILASKPSPSSRATKGKRIDKPSRRPTVYDRDPNVKEYYDSIDPLKS